MKLMIFCVHDYALDRYARPVYVATEAAAVRSFRDECTRAAPENEMYRHPADFNLYRLGVFDDEKGLFETHQPVLLCNGLEMLKDNKS